MAAARAIDKLIYNYLTYYLFSKVAWDNNADADAILKATMVDGVYDKDPKKYPDAKRYSTVSFSQVLAQNLNVMDMTAASLCRESKIPIIVFDLSDPENICRALCGYDIGTIVKEA